MNQSQALTDALALIARAAAELMPGIPHTNNADKLFTELATFHKATTTALKEATKPDTKDYKTAVVESADKVSLEYEKSKAKFVKGFADAQSHTLKWQAESIMRLEETNTLMRHAVARLNDVTDNSQAKAKVEEYIQWLTRSILRLPPKHNSTSEVENMLSLCSNEAKCNVIISLYEITGTELL